MSFSDLSAKTDFGPDSPLYPRDRRTPSDSPGDPEPKEPVKPLMSEAPPSGNPVDAAYYASRFKTDLTALAFLAGAQDGAKASLSASAREAYARSDSALFDFFGNLSVLLISVRAGDIERARAAADALAMEVMVEAGAGVRIGEPGAPDMLGDLKQLLSAAQSGDERAARAAALELARDVRNALEAPRKSIEAENASTSTEPAAEATGAAYDTLSAYVEDDVQNAA